MEGGGSSPSTGDRRTGSENRPETRGGGRSSRGEPCKEQPGPSPRRPPPRHVPPPRTPLLKVQRPQQLPSYGLRRGDHRGGRHWGRAAQPGTCRGPRSHATPPPAPPPTESRLIGVDTRNKEKEGKTLGHWGPLHSSRVSWTLMNKPGQTGSCLPGTHGHISSAPRRLRGSWLSRGTPRRASGRRRGWSQRGLKGQAFLVDSCRPGAVCPCGGRAPGARRAAGRALPLFNSSFLNVLGSRANQPWRGAPHSHPLASF